MRGLNTYFTSTLHYLSTTLSFLVLGMGIGFCQQGSVKASHQFPDSLYQKHTWETFETLEIAQDTIIPYFIDQSLLNAAVFYVTNKIRVFHGLNPFRFDAQLRSMASFHASQMAEHKFVGHINYFHLGYATLDARAMKFLADAAGENVANMFLYQYRSNTRYQANEQEYGYEYTTSQGSKIPRHTYLSFAHILVESWMQSPGHRENILDKEYEYLGCGLSISPDAFASKSIPLAYGVQNFGF